MNAPLRPTNKFREGSTAHRAFRHLEHSGRVAGASLARALDLDEEELPELLGFGLRNGSFARDGDVWMIRDGRPVSMPPPPPAPAPPPLISRDVIPPAVLDLPPGAPPPRKATPVAAPPHPAPAPVRSGVDIDAAHILRGEQLDRVRKPAASVTKPRILPEAQVAHLITAAPKVAPPAEPERPPPPPPEPAPVPTQAPEPHPAPVADRPRAVAAFCSDGTYTIERGSTRIDMDLDEAREVFEHMQFVWRSLA